MEKNIDYVRSLTVEELADKLQKNTCPSIFGGGKTCWEYEGDCYKCWEDWLEEEWED